MFCDCFSSSFNVPGCFIFYSYAYFHHITCAEELLKNKITVLQMLFEEIVVHCCEVYYVEMVVMQFANLQASSL